MAILYTLGSMSRKISLLLARETLAEPYGEEEEV
jgi:hypothetical protein